MVVTRSRVGSEHDFRCRVEPDREIVRVIPFGELDVDTVAQVADRVSEMQQAGFAEVVLDLRNLTFMDSSGLHLVLAADRMARSNGTRFVLIAGSRPIQRLFEIVGLQEILTFRAA
jgi:anti-sigma B factor antagonist